MPKIEELLQKNDEVWFALRTRKAGIAFMKELKKMGFTYKDKSPLNVRRCGYYMAVNDIEKDVSYISGMIWNLTLEVPKIKFLRVDYLKFKNDEEDYIVKYVKPTAEEYRKRLREDYLKLYSGRA